MQQTFSESKMKCDKRKYRRLERRFAKMTNYCIGIYFNNHDAMKKHLKTARNHKQ